MTLLCVGLDHRSAPMHVLAETALDAERSRALLLDAVDDEHVAEALVLATCNRVEVYADVERFHPAVEALTEIVAKHTGLGRDRVVELLRVRYDEAAVAHLMSVTSGLESVVPGETQVLAQVRAALRSAQDEGTAGRSLNAAVQSALRAGKRVHTETDVAAAGASVVSAGLDLAVEAVGDLGGRHAVVVGAGAMGVLAVASLSRSGVASLTVVNRTRQHAERIAATHGAEVAGLDALPELVARADVVVTAVGAGSVLLSTATVLQARASADGPLVVVDLGLPPDTDADLALHDGVVRIDLETLRTSARTRASEDDLAQARRIVAEEVAEHAAASAARVVEPTLVALRAHASEVLAGETSRLRSRMPDLSATEWDEVERSFRRVVSTLLHTPTVRIKEHASGPEGRAYAEALRALFDLDADTLRTVTSPTDPD
jgi:glutamyl-tRNA reductase